MLPDPFQNRFASRAIIATPVAGAAAAVVWATRLSTVETLVVMFAAGAVVDVLGIWWEERTRARQTRGTPEGVVKLVGIKGVMTASTGAAGTIRIGFELWEARSETGESLSVGQRVLVRRASGKTLFVRPLP